MKLDRLINVVALLLSGIWALGYVLSLVYLILGAETFWAASYLGMALLVDTTMYVVTGYPILDTLIRQIQ